MERPQLDLSAPDTGSVKSYSKGASIDTNLTLVGVAQPDPMAGRFIPESDPRAQAAIARHLARQATKQAPTPKKKGTYDLGARVFHRKRGQGNIVGALEGKRIAVVFASGEQAMVQVANLERV